MGGVESLTGPAPEITGTRPPDRVPWWVAASRENTHLAGPHSARRFRELNCALERMWTRPPINSRCPDTHVCGSPGEWMNVKMGM